MGIVIIAAVQNELHLLFLCQDVFVSFPRKKHSLLLPSGQSIPLEAPSILNALPRQTVFDFLF